MKGEVQGLSKNALASFGVFLHLPAVSIVTKHRKAYSVLRSVLLYILECVVIALSNAFSYDLLPLGITWSGKPSYNSTNSECAPPFPIFHENNSSRGSYLPL